MRRQQYRKNLRHYALFGFLSYWRDMFSIQIPEKDIHALLDEGGIEPDLKKYIKDASVILSKGCKDFTAELSHVFASSDKLENVTGAYILDVCIQTVRPNLKCYFDNFWLFP